MSRAQKHKHRMGRRKRDLQRAIAEQQRRMAEQAQEIAVLEKDLSRVSNERDRLLRQAWDNGSEALTQRLPRSADLIPVTMSGRTVATVRPGPSWADKG